MRLNYNLTGSSNFASSGNRTQFLPQKVTNVPTELLRTFPHTKRVGNYLLGRTLGEGSFAKVKEGLHTLTGQKVAIKVIDKKKAKEDAYVRRNLRREGKLLQMVKQHHVVQLFEIMETENSYYLVTELCRGGDLMDHICNKKKLDEKETRKYIGQVILAVDYLHKAGILHRDLKVENLLLDENRDIKIIDFGLSNAVRVSQAKDGSVFQEFCVTQCGSPAYAAPELLGNKKYGPQVDVWSIGVNMYAMLTGNLPFTVEPFNIKSLHKKMLNGDMNPLPHNLSKGCKDLLKRFLTPDPDKRITLKEAMNHQWINEGRIKPLEPAPFPNSLRADDVDQNILKHMAQNMDYRLSEVIRLVTSNIPNNATATYNLLFQKLQAYTAEMRINDKVSASDDRFKNRRHNNLLQETPPAVTGGEIIDLLPLNTTDTEADEGHQATTQNDVISALQKEEPKSLDVHISPRGVPITSHTRDRPVRRQIRNVRTTGRTREQIQNQTHGGTADDRTDLAPDTEPFHRQERLTSKENEAHLHTAIRNDTRAIRRGSQSSDRGKTVRTLGKRAKTQIVISNKERDTERETHKADSRISRQKSMDLPGIATPADLETDLPKTQDDLSEDKINNNLSSTTDSSCSCRYAKCRHTQTLVKARTAVTNGKYTKVGSPYDSPCGTNARRNTMSGPPSRLGHIRTVVHKGTLSNPSTKGEQQSVRLVQRGAVMDKNTEGKPLLVDVGSYDRYARRGNGTLPSVRNNRSNSGSINSKYINLAPPSQSGRKLMVPSPEKQGLNQHGTTARETPRRISPLPTSRMTSVLRTPVEQPSFSTSKPPTPTMEETTVIEEFLQRDAATPRRHSSSNNTSDASCSTRDNTSVTLPSLSPPLMTGKTHADI